MTPPKLKNGGAGMKGFLRIGLFSGCMYFLFLPKNNWFMPILYCNYFLILSLCYFQWKRDFRESYMRRRAAFLDHSGAAFIGIGLKLKAYSKLS